MADSTVDSAKTFSLLSIGQRGVGKTVFMAGSYAELQTSGRSRRPNELWFDCQDDVSRQNIDNILNYIKRNGQYPPPTMRITNFSFSLKQNRRWRSQILCNFRWYDLPGEVCTGLNTDFREIVLSSHGCCAFIDAYAIVYDPDYLRGLVDIISQVLSIASLVSLNKLDYAFALVFTKCDLFKPGTLRREQLDHNLRHLILRLDGMRLNYEVFYSMIPITPQSGGYALNGVGGAEPILWLVQQLNRVHNSGLLNGLNNLVQHFLLGRPSTNSLQEGPLNGLFRAGNNRFR
ncbi:hypothetical protein [Anthocerotibacter panamensis]|uniref:hypothetical protein n=1 Tax=Anthocerotibacter panamensis TaxID=2857077 RepID=UPI001C40342B|nr:hypothetical protein [Anthocerotibacter panamensis]